VITLHRKKAVVIVFLTVAIIFSLCFSVNAENDVSEVQQSEVQQDDTAVLTGLDLFETIKKYKSGTFRDIKTWDWYYSNVVESYNLGLLSGKGNRKFGPNDDISNAEIIALASRIHNVYYAEGYSFEESEPWYQSYVDYAISNQLISEELDTALEEPASRLFVVSILSKSIDEKDLEQINTVEDGDIPDLPADCEEKDTVYLLYRAGVVSGTSEVGHFNPEACISRAEVAAIATRIVNPTLRQTFRLHTEMKLPVLAFHSVGDIEGSFNISTKTFRAIVTGLMKKGFTPVSCSEVIAWVNGDGTLPEKPIIFTFDDGYENNYLNAYPILRELKAKGTMFVIGSYVGKSEADEGNAIIPHCTLDQLQIMQQSGVMEIMSHTYGLHQSADNNSKTVRSGVLQLRGEKKYKYTAALKADYEKFVEEIGSFRVLSYPYGNYTELSDKIFADLGVEMTFSTEPRTNIIRKYEPDSLYHLGRYEADQLTFEEILPLVQ